MRSGQALLSSIAACVVVASCFGPSDEELSGGAGAGGADAGLGGNAGAGATSVGGTAGTAAGGSAGAGATGPLVPAALDVTPGPVLLPNASATITPSWQNDSAAEVSVAGTATISSGATLTQANAAYTIGPGASGSCTSCYEIAIGSRAKEPAHWDLELSETLSTPTPPTKAWSLHVGSSFSDVAPSDPIFAQLETLVHHGVVDVSAKGTFGPDNDFPRSELSIWVARLRKGSDAGIPVNGTIIDGNSSYPYNCIPGGPTYFTDVPGDHPACRHIHYLIAEAVVVGGIGVFQPDMLTVRGQLAAFVAKSVLMPPILPTSGPGYDCKPVGGMSNFPDVDFDDPYCPSTNYLLAQGLTDVVCFGGGFCPTVNAKRRTAVSWLAQIVTLELYSK